MVLFDDAQIGKLNAPLDEAQVHTRQKQGMALRYLEGHFVIDQANHLFGYGGWGYRITKMEMVAGVWVATVLLTVGQPGGPTVDREDVGVGIPAVARDAQEATPDAQETAIKGAATDALKRALRTFGNQFGNTLYDKDANKEANAAAARENGEQSRAARAAAPITDGDDEQHPCPTCDQPMVLRSGTTRDGRPFSAWFCSAKCGNKPIWLSSR